MCPCPTRAIMSPDELVYLGILAASIPAGFFFRYLSEYFGPMRPSHQSHSQVWLSDIVSQICYLFFSLPVQLVTLCSVPATLSLSIVTATGWDSDMWYIQRFSYRVAGASANTCCFLLGGSNCINNLSIQVRLWSRAQLFFWASWSPLQPVTSTHSTLWWPWLEHGSS